MKKIIIILVVLVLVMSIVSGAIVLRTTEKDIYQESFTREEIIADFLDVAFTDRMLGEKEAVIFDKGAEGMRKHTPWLYKNIIWESGIFEHNVINKWARNIEVSVGEPNQETEYPHFERYAKRAVNNIVKSTKLPITYIPHREEYSETRVGKGDYAPVRIIPTRPNRLAMRKLDFLGDRYVYEPTFKNGVLFETSDIVDMFAYNLPNAKNNIGMTICKINMELDAQISRVLVEECIFRSLGLPGFHNKYHDKKISSIFALDRVNTSPSYYKGLPSEYDYRLISLLYCDAVKPGMNQVEVREVLMKNRKCFKQGKEADESHSIDSEIDYWERLGKKANN